MDFRLYARVIWRFKWVVMLGLIVAVGLAGLSVVKVGKGGKIAYRQAELWASTARLGVTQQGFPWGRLFAEDPTTATGAPSVPVGIPVADPNRLNNLAVLYAELATSDPVRRLMLKDGPIRGQIVATPLVRGDNRIMLPLVDVLAISTSPRAAIQLATRSATAFETFIHEQQAASNVPATDRVVIQEVIQPRKAVIYRPRAKTMPIVVFLAVMLATIGFAFLLENLRPRRPELDVAAKPALPDAARRTA